jgi:hypothetical protein
MLETQAVEVFGQPSSLRDGEVTQRGNDPLQSAQRQWLSQRQRVRSYSAFT